MTEAATDPSREGSLKPVTAYTAFGADGAPYLQGSRCRRCSAVFLGPRENCANCAARGEMETLALSTTGKLYNFTVVYRSLPGVTVPFVSAIVDLDGGGTVKGNLLDIEPDPRTIAFGMPVRMVFRPADIAVAAGEGFLSHFFVPDVEEAGQ